MISKHRHVTRIGKRNQVTIPASMLRELGVGPGEQVEVVRSNGSVVLRKAEDPIARGYGLLYDPNRKPMTDEEMKQAIREAREEAALKRYQRSLEAD